MNVCPKLYSVTDVGMYSVICCVDTDSGADDIASEYPLSLPEDTLTK